MRDIHFRSLGDPHAGLNGGVSLFQFSPRVLVNLAVNEGCALLDELSDEPRIDRVRRLGSGAAAAELFANTPRPSQSPPCESRGDQAITLGKCDSRRRDRGNTECDIFYSSTRNTLPIQLGRFAVPTTPEGRDLFDGSEIYRRKRRVSGIFRVMARSSGMKLFCETASLGKFLLSAQYLRARRTSVWPVLVPI